MDAETDPNIENTCHDNDAPFPTLFATVLNKKPHHFFFLSAMLIYVYLLFDHFQESKRRDHRDVFLFAQSENSCYGDCVICCLPMPFKRDHAYLMPCCTNMICGGCFLANKKRERDDWEKRNRIGLLKYSCPFCRQPIPVTEAEFQANLVKRANEANDPAALREVGLRLGYSKGDYATAFHYWTKAAEMGDIEAHHFLSGLYRNGEGVTRNLNKFIYHSEEATIGGHPTARYTLGAFEWECGSKERAVKHWIIAANLGEDDSMKELKKGYKEGLVSKDEYTATLRAYQTAVDAMKSPQREAACMDCFNFGMYDYCDL